MSGKSKKDNLERICEIIDKDFKEIGKISFIEDLKLQKHRFTEHFNYLIVMFISFLFFITLTVIMINLTNSPDFFYFMTVPIFITFILVIVNISGIVYGDPLKTIYIFKWYNIIEKNPDSFRNFEEYCHLSFFLKLKIKNPHLNISEVYFSIMKYTDEEEIIKKFLFSDF